MDPATSMSRSYLDTDRFSALRSRGELTSTKPFPSGYPCRLVSSPKAVEAALVPLREAGIRILNYLDNYPHAAAVVQAAVVRAGAEVEAAGGRPRRRADGGAAAGGGVETAADRRGRM